MWQAYKYEKKDYLPQILDLVSDESIEMDFMAKIKQIHGYQEEWSERLKEYLLKNYPAGSDKKIKKEELLKLIV
jgi:Immunity protein Imm6